MSGNVGVKPSKVMCGSRMDVFYVGGIPLAELNRRRSWLRLDAARPCTSPTREVWARDELCCLHQLVRDSEPPAQTALGAVDL